MSSITINSNIASLNAQRRLGRSTSSLQESFSRLSSGLRINRASDDAAGLAIAESLNVDRHVFAQGVRNLNDGVSLLSIADGALSELTGITIRLTELAEQAANGSLGNTQRKALDEEAQALKDEYLRISRTTEFNGQKLFDGQFGELRLQAGYGASGGIQSSLGGELGSGSFGTAVSYATEARISQAVALGDLNGDGSLDLVTAGRIWATDDGYATVQLGQGDGSFGAATSYATEAQRSSDLSLDDVNGDGVLDLVTAGETDDGKHGFATVRIGLGDGSFGAAISHETDDFRSYGLALGDVNNDGLLDLVTAGQDDGTTSTVTISLGNGDGSFKLRTKYASEGDNSKAVRLGDLNGDGLLDLVSAGYNTGNGGFASVRLGLGDGSFGARTSYSSETFGSSDVLLGDLDGDGLLDLVTTGYEAGADRATVRLGVGDGTFGAATSTLTDAGDTHNIALGDINGDGTLDLVTAGDDGASNGSSTIRLGLGDGSFGASTSYVAESRESRFVTLGDVSNDGVLDLVTAGRSDPFAGYATVRLGETVDGVAPLLEFSLSTQAGARQALPVFKSKLDQLAAQRGQIGAVEARINTAVSNTRSATETITAAASQITDADIAIEAANLVRNQILQQAGAAVLAQANQGPALALRLLG